MIRVKVSKLWRICVDIFLNLGVGKEDADIIADSIIYAHTRGKHTHGAGRIPIYIRKINDNLLNKNTPIEIIRNTAIIGIVDAKHGFGQVAGIKSMDMAMEKAKIYGLGLVGVKDSNNFGVAGFIAERAINSNLIGIVMANSGPAIAPTGGKRAIFGTNPICVAFPPAKDNPPIVFDMACSKVARGKIRLAEENKEKIPYGWAIDENGMDTDDPLEALKGTMLPIGGYKGYGLAMCVDIIAGMMTGSAFGGDTKNLNHPTEFSRHGHLIIAINPDFFMSREEYKTKMALFYKKVKDSGDTGEVMLPGESSFLNMKKNGDMVEIGEGLILELDKLAENLGIRNKLQNIVIN